MALLCFVVLVECFLVGALVFSRLTYLVLFFGL
jgi:hypothetical protein